MGGRRIFVWFGCQAVSRGLLPWLPCGVCWVFIGFASPELVPLFFAFLGSPLFSSNQQQKIEFFAGVLIPDKLVGGLVAPC